MTAAAPTVAFDQRDGYIWLDGRFVEWKHATLHVLTHGLHYASCVYEGERVYDEHAYTPSAITFDLMTAYSEWVREVKEGVLVDE